LRRSYSRIHRNTRLRSIVSKAFTPRAVRACEPFVDTYAHECIDAILERGKVDLIDETPPYVPLFFIRCPEHYRIAATGSATR